MSRQLDYHVVDVFTDRAFAGNPLAVVLGADGPGADSPGADGAGADGLSTAQMQAIASEFNLSETTFPLPPTQDGADYRLRIFTPATELPFAGHPSVGSAWLLHSLGRVGAGRVVQECGAGLLPLQVSAESVTLTGGAPTLGAQVDLGALCAAVGLSPSDAVGTPARWAGTGIEFAYLHVTDDALGRCTPDIRALAGFGNAGVSVFSFAAGPPGQAARVHARVFAAGAGVPEDPATGSAGLGLGVWLVDAGLLPGDGVSSYVVEQGLEMGRPSRLSCTVAARGGSAVEARVAGSVVPVAQGRIAVP